MRCFFINVIDDFNREHSEAFEVVLLSSAGVILAEPYVATVTIIDDDSNRKPQYCNSSCVLLCV